MSKKPDTAPPIGMDLPRIEAALRKLAFQAMVEDLKAGRSPTGNPADWPDTEMGRLIYLPLGEAARGAHAALANHLANCIGSQAATEILQRINAEVSAEAVTALAPAARSSAEPIVRH